MRISQLYLFPLPLTILLSSFMPSNALPVNAVFESELHIAVIPSNPPIEDISDGYRITARHSSRSNKSRHPRKHNSYSHVTGHEFKGHVRIGDVDLKLDLPNPVDVGSTPFDICFVSGHSWLPDMSGCALISHLGVPDSLLPPQDIPYMVTPPQFDDPVSLKREYWSRWQLTPSPKENYYSFNYGPVHVIMLDTLTSRPYEMLHWLKLDFKRLNRELYPWVIVAGYESLDNFGEDISQEIQEVLTVREADVLLFGTSLSPTRIRVGNDKISLSYFDEVDPTLGIYDL